MASTTPYGISDVTKAIEDLSKAGLTTSQILEGGLYGALTLAAAGEIELEEAANLAARALITFKNDGLSVADAADILVGAANKSTTSVGEIGSSFEMVSVVAANAGLTMKDTATALAVFAQNGMAGSDAGTSLKTMLMNLTPQSAKATKYMKELGIITADGANQFYDASGKMKDMAGIADIMQKSFKGLNDEQRIHYMRTIFGQDAIRGATVLYKEGADGIRLMASAIESVDARSVAERKWDTLSTKIKVFKNNLALLGAEVFNRFEPALSALVKKATEVVNWFRELPGGVQKAIVIFGAIVAAIGPLLLVFGSVAGAIGNIVALFGLISGAAGGAVVALLPAIAAIGAIVIGVSALAIGINKAHQDIKKRRDAIHSDTKAYNATTEKLLKDHNKKIRDANKETLDNYIDMSAGVEGAMKKMRLSAGDDTYKNEFLSGLSTMVAEANRIIQDDNSKTLVYASKLFGQYSFLSEDVESDILKDVVSNNEAKVASIRNSEKEITSIMDKASKERRDLTKEEYQAVQVNLDNINKQTVKSLSKTNFDMEAARADIVTAGGKANIKANDEFLKLNAEHSKEVIANAKLAAGEELAFLEQLRDEGLITYEQYIAGKEAILERYKNTVKEVQVEELKGLVSATEELIKWNNDYQKKIQERDALEKKRAISNGELTEAEKTRLSELNAYMHDNYKAAEEVQGKIEDNIVAIQAFDPQIKALVNGVKETLAAAGILSADEFIRKFGSRDWVGAGISVGAQLAMGYKQGWLKSGVMSMIDKLGVENLGVYTGGGTDPYDTTRFQASGGINRGGNTIVGEAGPELLSVGLGGVAVTPLTGAAKARNVEQAFGGSNVFNISVEGGWDNADRIANRVADTMNRVLGSRGVNYVR